MWLEAPTLVFYLPRFSVCGEGAARRKSVSAALGIGGGAVTQKVE